VNPITRIAIETAVVIAVVVVLLMVAAYALGALM